MRALMPTSQLVHNKMPGRQNDQRLQHTSAAATAVQLGNDLAQLIEHKALNSSTYHRFPQMQVLMDSRSDLNLLQLK